MDKNNRHTLFDAYHLGTLGEQERINFEQDLKKDSNLEKEYNIYLAVVKGIEQHAENDLRAFLNDKKSKSVLISPVDKELVEENSNERKIIPFYFKAVAASIVFFIASYFLFSTFDNNKSKDVAEQTNTDTTENLKKSKNNLNDKKADKNITEGKKIDVVKKEANNKAYDSLSKKLKEDDQELDDDTNNLVVNDDNFDSITIGNTRDLKRKDIAITEIEQNKIKSPELFNKPNLNAPAPNNSDFKFSVLTEKNILDTQLLLNNFTFTEPSFTNVDAITNTRLENIKITNSSPATPKKSSRKGKTQIEAYKKKKAKADIAAVLPPLEYYKLLINESPLKYKGYKFDTTNKLLNVYGIKPIDLQFFYMDHKYYLQNEAKIYIMKINPSFSPLVEEKNKKIIKKINEYSGK